MNKAAGRWAPVIITLRLENGEEVPMVLATGSWITLVDPSLRGQVGKKQREMTVAGPEGGLESIPIHRAPKLLLGGAQSELKEVGLRDCSTLGIPAAAKGILGVDFLKSYCVQLDFENLQMRFIKPGEERPGDWGVAQSVTWVGKMPFVGGSDREGSRTGILINTGEDADLRLPSEKPDEGDWTMHELSEWSWNGATYTNLLVRTVGVRRVMGWRMLARHLVTLDLGHDRIYFKRVSTGPLTVEREDQAEEFLKKLYQSDDLPGWRRFEDGAIYADFEIPLTLAVKKTRDPSIVRYTVEKTSDGWRVKKAWRTDERDHLQETFNVEKLPVLHP